MANDNPPPADHDLFELSADSTRQVANDQAEAVFYAERVGPELAPLQDEVNQLIAQGAREAATVPLLVVRTGNYSVQPEYELGENGAGRQTGYRVRQTLLLESRDLEALRKLVGRLQKTLALDGLNFSLSREARRTVENEVMVEALKAFDQRARVITETVGATAYRRRQIAVRAASPSFRRPPGGAIFAAAASGSMEAPAMAAGEAEVVVTVTGSIELSFELQR